MSNDAAYNPPPSSVSSAIVSIDGWIESVNAARVPWEASGSSSKDLAPFRPFITQLYQVFSDMHTLNASFLCEKENEKNAEQQQQQQYGEAEEDGDVAMAVSQPTTPKASISTAAASDSDSSSGHLAADLHSPAIDYASLDNFYNCVDSIVLTDSSGNESRPLQNSMLNGMRQLLTSLNLNIKSHFQSSPLHPSIIRFIPILYENANLWYNMEHYALFNLLHKCVAALPETVKEVIVNWMSDVDTWKPEQEQTQTLTHADMMTAAVTSKDSMEEDNNKSNDSEASESNSNNPSDGKVSPTQPASGSRLYSTDRLERLVGALQQFISVRLSFDQNDLREVVPAVQMLALTHEANIKFEQIYANIPLSVPRIQKRPVPLNYELFYNDVVNSEDVDLRIDFRRWKRRTGEFSFVNYPFILDAGSKAILLRFDAQVQMHNVYRDAVLSAGLDERAGYLLLQVRRNHIISDSLRALAHKRSEDFKKPLRIHFQGEKGIDAGGLRKEFFQLVIGELFDARYGMFLVDEESRTFRFNPDSLESTLEFELIGTLIGLAIYNSTILDLHFPTVVYKKLLDRKPTLEDLAKINPSLAHGLVQLLEFDGDVESTFARDFTVSYKTAFDEQKVHELKPDGSNIPVTNSNRHEFVELYVEWMLSKSIERQFKPFYKGFHQVCGGEALKLFRPTELELLVCGSSTYDFEELESVTRYEDGYEKNSPIIRDFWSIVHNDLSQDEKRKLLEFCTGSDRVPIRGLASINLTISKAGPDSQQLPTSHTCFNHLLLPDYAASDNESRKEKLRRLLRLALQNSKGFGLI